MYLYKILYWNFNSNCTCTIFQFFLKNEWNFAKFAWLHLWRFINFANLLRFDTKFSEYTLTKNDKRRIFCNGTNSYFFFAMCLKTKDKFVAVQIFRIFEPIFEFFSSFVFFSTDSLFCLSSVCTPRQNVLSTRNQLFVLLFSKLQINFLLVP